MVLMATTKYMIRDYSITIVTYFTIYTTLVGVSASPRRGPVNNFYCFKNDLVFWLDSCIWKYTIDDLLDKEVAFIWGDGSGAWNHAKIHPPNRTYINNLHIGTFNLIVGINVTSQQGGSMAFTSYLSDVWVVQLPSLVSFTGTALNSSCVQLSWKKGGNSRFEKELYVNCTSVLGEQKDREFRIYGETHITLCGLRPGRVYSCSAKSRIVTLDKKYPSNNPKFFWWSGYSTANVKTKNDVPGASPNITAGGYSWENNEDCQTKNNRGHVWVYWEPINMWYYNGEFIGTQISYNTTEGETSLQVNNSMNSIRLEVLCNQSHIIYIRAVNDVGESKTPSILLISPPFENNLEFIVEVESNSRHQNTSIRYLEWGNSNQNDGERITVFYAEKLPSGPTENPKLCDPGFVGQIDWKIVDSTVNKTEITVGDKPYCYAVTTGNPNRSFGINWTACLYVKNEAPKSPENVRITNSSHGVMLQWHKSECSAEQPYVKWYEIGTCSEPSHCAVETRLPSNTSYVTLNQSRFPEHMVAVRAVTRLGVSGNWSQPLQVSPLVSELSRSSNYDFLTAAQGFSGGQIAGMVIGVSGSILMTVFICTGVRKYRRHLYNLKVEPPEVFPDTEPIHIRTFGYEELGSQSEPTLSEIYLNYNLHYQETQPHENLGTQVTDISGSTEDSYIRFETLLQNGVNTDNDRRENLGTQVTDISGSTEDSYIRFETLLQNGVNTDNDRRENLGTQVTDISGSTEDSYIRFETLLQNGVNTDNDRRELNGQTFEISEHAHLKSLNNGSNDTRLNVNPESDYVMTTDRLYPGNHQKQQNEFAFFQTGIRESDKSKGRQSDELTSRYLMESNESKLCALWGLDMPKQYHSQESFKLKQIDLRELDKTTKKDPVESGATKPLDFPKTIVLEQNVDQETDESSKTDTNLPENIRHNPLNYCASGHCKSWLEGNYVTSESIVMENPKQRNVRPKTHLNTGYIMMNGVMATLNRPSRLQEVVNQRQQTSDNSDHSKSDKSGSVGEYVTSIPAGSSNDNTMKDAKISESECSENVEIKPEKYSISCFEGGIILSHYDTDRSESCLVEMGDIICDQVNSTTIFRLTGIQDGDRNFSYKESCNDSEESYNEINIGGYIDQVTAAKILSQRCTSSAENIEPDNDTSSSAYAMFVENVSNNEHTKDSSITVRQLTASNDGYVTNETDMSKPDLVTHAGYVDSIIHI